MKKRTSAVVLLIVLLFLFTSCSFENNNEKSAVQETTQTTTSKTIDNDSFTDKYKAITLTYGYDGLDNDAQRACYDAMKEIAGIVTEETLNDTAYLTQEATVSMSVEDKDVFIAFAAFRYDNPQFFWLKKAFTSANGYDGLKIRLCSYYSASDLEQKQKEYDKKVNEIISSIESGLSDFELELYIHDYIVDNCEYDSAAADEAYSKTDKNCFESFSSYGALVKGKAICQGYADAMAYLLSCVGIESMEISGTSQGENHIWNAVKIQDDWYYLDVTWDDQKNQAYKYNYFNITTSQLETDHTIAGHYTELTDTEITGDDESLGSNFNIVIPDCQSTEYNYYAKKAAVLQGFDSDCDNQVADMLLIATNNIEEYFHIYVDQNYIDYTYACEQLFDPYIYHFQNYVYIVNQQYGYDVLDTSAAIVKKENLSVITVKLSYL